MKTWFLFVTLIAINDVTYASDILSNNITKLEQLNEWKVIKNLTDDLKISIKILCVFGYNISTQEYGKQVVFVTNDDLVYVFGDNYLGVLGINSNNKRIENPVKVDIMSNKEISKIAYGSYHVIALTESGDVYSWGSNRFGQTGNGFREDSVSPHLISFESNNTRIVDVCCGEAHSLVLTDFGEIYSWGDNSGGQCGNSINIEQLTPYKINGFNNKKVIAISCGTWHSMALTESGEVFSWGYNGSGELGIRNNVTQYKPIRVINLDSVNITKIAAGSYFSMLLSSNGEIYAFGYKYRALGIENEENQNKPVKISISVKFKDIFSFFYFGISIALSVDNKFYIWGNKFTRPKLPEIPTATNFKSINDVYASFSEQVTWNSGINFENNL